MSHEKFHKFSSLTLAWVGVGLLFGPQERFPDFYHPVYLGVVALLSPLFIYAPYFAMKQDTFRKRSALLKLASVAAFSVSMNMLGELGLFQLYRFGFEYDKFAHFTVSMLFTYVFCEVLMELTRFGFRRAVITAASIVFVCGILWEAIEFSSDILFGTQEWGVYRQDTISDTIKDILFNTIGIFFGLIILSTRIHFRMRA